MKQIKKILFPTDYSQFANDAIEYAIAFTREFKAKMYIMHVVELSTHDPSNPLYKKPNLEEYTDIKDFVKSSTERQVRSTRVSSDKFQYEELSVMGLSAGREILNTAKDKDIDLIVMASHGAGFFERLLLGSTTEMVMKEASCPVLIVKKEEREFVDFDADKIRLNSILCPIDFSECSKLTLKTAGFLAKKLGAEIVIINVVEEMFEMMDFIMENFSVDEFNEKRQSLAKNKLNEFCEKYIDEGVDYTSIVTRGNPKRGIAEYAKKNGIDLIVVGAYGRGEEDGIIFSGSITTKVVKRADCPVLVVR